MTRTFKFSLALATVVALASLTSPLTAEVVISEIDFASGKVELVNIGTANVNMTSYWLCNRVNGSPFYTNDRLSAHRRRAIDSHFSGCRSR